jgi:hypothetical protein
VQEEFDNLSDIVKEWLGPPITRCSAASAVRTAQPDDSVAALVAQLGTEIRVYFLHPPLPLHEQPCTQEL